MTDYKFSGIIVDLKADNSHASARVAATMGGTDLDGGQTQISAGCLVVTHASEAGRIDAGGADSLKVVGVATQTRAEGDSRPLTYTRSGLVHCIKNASSLPTGSKVKSGEQGTVVVASNSDADTILTIGRCVEGSTATVGGEVVVVQLTL